MTGTALPHDLEACMCIVCRQYRDSIAPRVTHTYYKTEATTVRACSIFRREGFWQIKYQVTPNDPRHQPTMGKMSYELWEKYSKQHHEEAQ